MVPITSESLWLSITQAKAKKISYMESDSEGTDGDDVFKPMAVSRSRPTKRRRLFDSDSEDVYEQEKEVEQEDGDYIWSSRAIRH